MSPSANISTAALDLVQDGQTLGLGSGRAARAFVEALGTRVAAGLRVRGVPTSRETADLARRCQVPLVTWDEVDMIDITLDGADEVDPHLNLIKGWGGALVREKIVAGASRRLVILVGEEKLVPQLGSRGKLPVEVVPFGWQVCRRRLAELGLTSELRRAGADLFQSDNGNYILDCAVPPLADPVRFEQQLRAIPGVVDTGLFLNLAETILVQHPGRVQVLQRNSAAPRSTA